MKSYQTCEMAHIIQTMQTDIAELEQERIEMKQERIVKKFLVLFHDAKKVLRPWENSFLANSYLRSIW